MGLVLFIVFLCILIVNISLVALPSNQIDSGKGEQIKELSGNDVSLLSKICFNWINRLILIGYRRAITPEDMWTMPNDESSRYNLERFEYEWSKGMIVENGKTLRTTSLFWIIGSLNFGKFLGGSLLLLVNDLLNLTGPIFLAKLIDFIKDEKQNLTVGVFLIALLIIVYIVQAILYEHYSFKMFVVGSRIRTAIMNVVYKKSMRLSSSARMQSTVRNI